MQTDLSETSLSHNKKTLTESLLEQIKSILIDLEQSIAKKNEARLIIQQNNPYFEEVSDENWRKKKLKMLAPRSY